MSDTITCSCGRCVAGKPAIRRCKNATVPHERDRREKDYLRFGQLCRVRRIQREAASSGAISGHTHDGKQAIINVPLTDRR
jgi:hypothetical protein